MGNESSELLLICTLLLLILLILCHCAWQDSDLILMTVHTIVSRTLSQWDAADFRDVEMALTLLYSVAEAVPVSPVAGFVSLL